MYLRIYEQFSFLEQLTTLPTEENITKAKAFIKHFSLDVEDELTTECVHLRGQLKSEGKGDLCISELYTFLFTEQFLSVYPNVSIALRMHMCTFATNCYSERSFSVLKRVKNYLRSTLSQDNLTNLSLLAIENDLLQIISYDDIIDKFSCAKSRTKC